MTREVWFQLVDGEGTAVTSADCVECADDAKVFRLRKAVFAEVSRALPATVIAADLTVFAVTQEGKKALEEDSPIGSFGGSKKDALIVQVPQRADIAPSYFILPETREKVAKAVFVIVEEDKDDKGVGMGVFKGVGMGVFKALAWVCFQRDSSGDV
ncbi:unnamed protein product [Phytophthora lilii]|uniref:Unnamed protein product n=1 Tax=Phytophthora lilii TaxID=2077276 RepID=A0A9W7CV30_9STRA|nr:unnamed protein product [Phytophthora lilii]